MPVMRRRIAALATVAALAAWGVGAWAHGLHFPKRNLVRVIPGELRIEVRYAVPEVEESERVRDRFDTDADGQLSGEERNGATRFLARQATRFLRLEIDGRAVDLRREEARLVAADRHGPSKHLGVDLELSASLPMGRAVELMLKDRLRHGERRIPLRLELQGYEVSTSSQEIGAERPRVHALFLSEGQPLRLELRPKS